MAAQRHSCDFDAAVERLWKTALGGVLVVLPGTVAAALGAPTAVLVGYLCIMVIVLSVVVLRRRLGRE